MVVGEGEVHHRSDLNLAINSHWLLVDGVKTKDSSLWEVDNGGAHERAKDAAVADGEGTTSHVLDGKLVVTSLRKLAEIYDLVMRTNLTFLPSSAIDFSISIMSMLSALRTTGVTRPFGVATATLMST